jgi:predicted PurR-regulated permease PerM
MIVDRSDQQPGARFLLMAASGVIVVGGLRLGAPVLLPTALSLFLAVLSLPIVLGLTRRGVPRAIAILAAVLVVVGIFTVLIITASQSLTELQSELFRYVGRLQALTDEWIASLSQRFDVALEEFITLEIINTEVVTGFVGGTLAQAATLLSKTFLVFLVMVFFLAEATILPEKLRYLTGGSPAGEERMNKIVEEIQSYLGIKTAVSLATGLLLGLWCWVMELDFPILLGLLAFALNYVPTVGSIIAGVPAIIFSLASTTHQGDVSHAFVVTLGYVVVNTVFGNLIEPNLMGRRLGLSPLVVILSLLFWGWTWGPMGALLSVPLTMIVKIWLENTQDLRWVAVLLDRTVPAAPRTAAAPDGPPNGARLTESSPKLDPDPGV